MKNYTITVNGKAYNVVVEEGFTAGAPVAAPAAPVAAAAVAAPAPVAPAAPVAAPAAPAGAAGAVEVTAAVPGKVIKVEAGVGQAVKSGDTVIIIEAMKMEIPVVAPQDGTVASINVSAGDAIESGAVLATLN